MNRMVSESSGQDGNGKSDARLDSLDMQLKAARKAEAVRSGKDQVPAKGMRQGNRVLTELIAGLRVVRWLVGYSTGCSALPLRSCWSACF
jgi:ATP synthase protein I